MKKIIVALVLLCTTGVYAQKNFIDQNYIEVSAKAEREVVPDEIYVHIVLNEADYKNRSLRDLEKDVVSVLKRLDIDEKEALKVCDVASSSSKSWFKRKTNTMQEYMLKLSTAQQLMGVAQGLNEAGIMGYAVEKVLYSKIDDLRSELKVEAMKRAAQKAKDLAGAVNQSVGRALYIDESDGDNYTPRTARPHFSLDLTKCELKQNAVEDLEFTSIKVYSEVLVRFELK